jgi:hypothetical protein
VVAAHPSEPTGALLKAQEHGLTIMSEAASWVEVGVPPQVMGRVASRWARRATRYPAPHRALRSAEGWDAHRASAGRTPASRDWSQRLPGGRSA